MKHRVIIFASFCIGLAIGAFSYHASTSGLRQKESLNTYLITSVQDLAKKAPENRSSHLMSAQLYGDITEFSQLSSESETYFWFTLAPETAKNLGIMDPTDLGGSFSGFYLVLTTEGVIRDFGYHKP